jgi:CRP/FNR family cyclic AMP-dependent transcriptional regulator
MGGQLSSSWPESTLLGRLPDATRAALMQLGGRAIYPPNGVILRQGGKDDHAVLLVRGLTKVLVSTPDGYEALLAVRVGGDLVGEMAILERKPRSATVISCVPTYARLIPADQLSFFFRRHSDAILEVSRMLSERLRWANKRRVDFAALPAMARVARILVEIAHTYGRSGPNGHWDLGVSLSHAELASFAAMKLRTAEKVVKQLHDQNAIAIGYRRIVVTDMESLRRIARISELDL